MTDDLRIEDVKRIRLNPGDVLVLWLPAHTPVAALEYASAQLRDAFPENKVFVLEQGATFEVIEGQAA